MIVGHAQRLVTASGGQLDSIRHQLVRHVALGVLSVLQRLQSHLLSGGGRLNLRVDVKARRVALGSNPRALGNKGQCAIQGTSTHFRLEFPDGSRARAETRGNKSHNNHSSVPASSSPRVISSQNTDSIIPRNQSTRILVITIGRRMS